MEKQHLQLINNDDGTVAEVILTTHLSIESVPVMGSISMGTVTIRVIRDPGSDGCEVSQPLQFSLHSCSVPEAIFCQGLSSACSVKTPSHAVTA